MTIEKRLERVEAILDARGLDWDHPRVAEEPAKEAEPDHPAGPRAVPSISPGEWLDIRDAYRDATAADVGKLVYVRNGEIESWIELRLAEVRGSAFPWRCRRDGLDPSNWQAFRYAVIRNEGPAKEAEPDHPAGPQPDPGEGYRLVNDSDIGKIVEVLDSLADPWRECTLLAINWGRPHGFLCRHSYPAVVQGWRFARIKIEEPGHPAGPMPDPGEGYRLLSKDPPEELQPGDEYETVAGNGRWVESENAHTNREQGPCIWYRRKIETPKPAEPEYREPVLPADAGKMCEFSDDGEMWFRLGLAGFVSNTDLKWRAFIDPNLAYGYAHARIRKDA